MMSGRGTRLRCAVIAIAIATLVACGDDASGVDSVACGAVVAPMADRAVTTLGAAERQALCDWSSCRLGGYGAVPSCASGQAVDVPRTRAQCDARLTMNPQCQVTVGQVQACFDALAAEPCASTFLFAEACAQVTDFDCLVTMMSAPVSSGAAGSGD